VITESAKLRERIRRTDFGHLDIEVTVDDPKAYTKPWTVTLRQQFAQTPNSSTKSVSRARSSRSSSNEIAVACVRARIAYGNANE
jgi:hypothetical protein